MAAPSTSRRRRVLVGVGATAGLLVIVGVIGVVLALRPYRASSESMAPTIALNDRVMANLLSSPGVGDVAVFHPPEGAVAGETKCGAPVAEDELCPKAGGGESEITFLKRIVAGPGDRVALRDGRVIRNGRPVDEPYIAPCEGGFGCDFRGEVTVPDDHWYLLGDNRGQSDDSRFWGPVPDDWIVGAVLGRYWPPSEVGGL